MVLLIINPKHPNTNMTKNEILIETVRFYSEDTTRRATISLGGCTYRIPPTDTMPVRCCAVGRCMTEDALNKYWKCSDFVDSLVDKYESGDVDNILRPEYHGHDIDFWRKLQALHDHAQHWRDKSELANFIRDCFGENALEAVRDAGLL